jgi:lysophospholipase L1-like esterase
VQKTLRSVVVILTAIAILSGIPQVKPTPPVNAAQVWNYAALGDSLAFGALALPLRGYTFLYRTAVANDTGNTVLLYNLGVPGWKSADLLNALRTSWSIRVLIATSRVITWDIGGNDMNAARGSYKAGTCGGLDNQQCLKDTVAQLKVNWDGIVAELHQLRNFDRTTVRTMDIYNPFVTEDMASISSSGVGTDFDVLKFYLDDVNAYIADRSLKEHVGLARVYFSFNGPDGKVDPKSLGFIAFDGFHPNDAGHAEMARLLRALGY